MSFLLDTNVVSEVVRPEPSPKVLNWMSTQRDDQLFISAISIGELWRGILLLPQSRKRRGLVGWIESDVSVAFAGRILPLDAAVMERWAHLHVSLQKVGRLPQPMDGLLAATAVYHGMTFVTRNIANFQVAGLRVLNPWL